MDNLTKTIEEKRRNYKRELEELENKKNEEFKKKIDDLGQSDLDKQLKMLYKEHLKLANLPEGEIEAKNIVTSLDKIQEYTEDVYLTMLLYKMLRTGIEIGAGLVD